MRAVVGLAVKGKRELLDSFSNGFSSMKKVLLFGGQGNQEKGMLDKFVTN